MVTRTGLFVSDTALINEWSEQNAENPQTLTSSSAKKVFWTCSKCSYHWKQSPNLRSAGKGCPRCAGRVLEEGVNDLVTIRPEVLSWWADPSLPTQYFPKSSKTVRWQCPAKHCFEQPIKRFNLKCPICIEKPLADYAPHLLKDWSDKNNHSPSELSYNSATTVIWDCHKCHHEWSTPAYQRVNGTICPHCSSHKKSSQGEEELTRFFISLGFQEGIDFFRYLRKPLNNRYELDFYFPSLQIGVEFNGLYWHSEVHKPHQYHFDKWKMAQDNQIVLLQVWEDDWLSQPILVKTMLTHKLQQTSSDSKIFARKTIPQILTYQEAKEFLEQNHIQGSTTGSIYLGLKVDDVLVAVSVWRCSGEIVYLDRYATSMHVLGGLGKMLNYFVNKFNPQTIVTFAAHDVSAGNIYEKLGFVVNKIYPADYWYLWRGRRVHKSHFRKHTFQINKNLQWEKQLTEQELARLNKILRIWDAGKTRYVLDLTKD